MWTLFTYESTSLFSLKISSATSSGGKSLLVPTPYCIKMAFVEAAFRAGRSDAECSDLCEMLRGVDVRIGVPERALVTHTFVKVRQENREARKTPTAPYKSTIAYRELVHHRGVITVAFDAPEPVHQRVVPLAPVINRFGKRGSFFQYLSYGRQEKLGTEFTLAVRPDRPWECPARAHIVPADDFGSDATLDVLSSFTSTPAKREKHRRFASTIVPLGVVNVGPGFTEYARE
jgi:hypothetical protein